MTRAWWLALAFVACFVAESVRSANGSGVAPRAVAEWWQASGIVGASDGHRYAFALKIARYATPRPERNSGAWSAGDVMPASATLIDIAAHRARSATRIERPALGLAASLPGRMSATVGTWSITGGGNAYRVRARYRDVAFAFTMSAARKPFCVGNGSRRRRYGELLRDGCFFTRVQTTGRIVAGGVERRVVGESWLEHESGPAVLTRADVGWTRIAVQFDDGRAALFTAPRARPGARATPASGFFISRDGRVAPLATPLVENALHTEFESPRTHLRYPSLWEVFERSQRFDLAVVPAVQDIEIGNDPATTTYDGYADVERAGPPGGDRGHAFVEVTGIGAPVVPAWALR